MPSEEKRKSRALYWALGAVVLTPVLYVLSIGPVASFCVWTGSQPPEAVQVMYAPVDWLYLNTPLQKPLDWYVRLCRGG